MQIPTTTATTVLYDGSCPICTREIQHYQKGAMQADICWVNVAAPDFSVPSGQSKEALMQRFHVITETGEWVSGAAAFVHLWEQLPTWKKWARVARIPGLLPLMEFGYNLFLFARPKLQKLFT
jgi:ubiquinone biosynthesis monooxygenase Coq7